MINFYNELQADFQEVEPLKFYRDIFPINELDKKDEFNKGKYVGIACEFTDNKSLDGRPIVKRYSITDELDEIKDLLNSDNFIIISPISYIGKSRRTANARVMYAFAIEIDDIRVGVNGRAKGYHDLIYQMKKELLPMCNYIVASGNGLHLYYLFDKPLVLYPNVKKSLINFKSYMTPHFWNRFITTSYKESEIQNESVFQGFRLAGGLSKKKDRTKIFEISKNRVSIDYLNSFADSKNKIDCVYKSDLNLDEAKEKYPEWYKKRILEKKSKESWTCKRDLYDWWLRKIKKEAKVGHRYYCLMILSIYAIKSGIDYNELEKDCFSLLENFDDMSDEDTNRFTKKDVVAALQSFQDKDLVTYPINSIIRLSGIRFEKNKRNYRKQKDHLERARAVQKIDYPNNEWINKDGRPTKEQLVLDFLEEHKNEKLSVTEIAKRLNVSRTTIYKYLK